MKEITIPVLWASAEFYLGALLWVAIAVLVVSMLVWLLALRRPSAGASLRASVRSLAGFAILAGMAVTAFIPALTRSQWAFVAGPTDYVVLIGAGVAAAIAILWLLTPVLALARPRTA